MAAEPGNNYYLKRSKHGRDKIFTTPEVLLEAAYEYFEHCDENPLTKNEVLKGGDRAGEIIPVEIGRPYTITGLCIFLDVDVETFRNYGEEEAYKDFFRVTTHIRKIIETNQIDGAVVGLFNPTITSRLLGLTDKQDITSGGKPVKNVISFGGKEVEV